jgi:SEC-C motif-containing protein
VRHHQQQDDSHATVEFVARYRIAGRGQRLRELSRFVRQDGRWYYVDGDIS